MSEGNFLELDLTLCRGERTFSWALADGARVLGIVGPSGVGKTSLLRALLGVEPQARGTLLVAGESWLSAEKRVPPWERGCGWVPQDVLLFPHRSVRENLGAARAASDGVEELAELVEATHLLERRPRHLSGGERQRVAIGRALGAARSLLLLDEPFAALDTELADRIAERVLARARARSIGVVLVSHVRARIDALVDEVWEMSERGLTRRS